MLQLANAYLDLMEKILTGVIIEDPPMMTESHKAFVRSLAKSLGANAEPTEAEMGRYHNKWREMGGDCPSLAFTMIGSRRLRNFRWLISRVIEEGVRGDILEAGVWRGGASIMARAVLLAYGDVSRRVYVADSFEGLPPPNPSIPQDAESTLHLQAELAVTLEAVRANFAKFDLLDEQVVFLKGWFRDTMPLAPITHLAVLRLDGDMYESTLAPLTSMYDRLSVGGWVIVDDFFFGPCKAAVSDFLGARGLDPEILPIDEAGVYFQKTA